MLATTSIVSPQSVIAQSSTTQPTILYQTTHESVVPSRQILWGIPSWYQYVLMYPLFIISLLFLFKNILSRYQFISKGSGELFSSIKGLSWGNFTKTILFQGKVNRDPFAARFHGLIIYSFLVHTIATTLVAIHTHTPIPIFQGTIYIAISFLADLAGITTLIGVLMAMYRRYVLKPAHLVSPAPAPSSKKELFMHLVLIQFIVIGFVLEAIRIYAINSDLNSLMGDPEKSWSPIGWWMAFFLHHIGGEPSQFGLPTIATIYRGIWLFHMLTVMAFFGILGSSKFSHMFLIPLSALFTAPNYRTNSGVILPMKLDFDETATEASPDGGPSEDPYFGLKKIKDLNKKMRFDVDVCIECGRCTKVCPANAAGRDLDPKKIITKIRNRRDEVSNEESVKGVKSFFTNLLNTQSKEQVILSDLFTPNELDACTTCGACSEECPAHIEHIKVITDLKRYNVLTEGNIRQGAADVVNNIKIKGNPWGISPSNRMNWLNSFEQNFPRQSGKISKENGGKTIRELIKIIEPGHPVQYLYYVGCAASFDPKVQKTVQATMLLLLKAKVDFAIIGERESCNGDPIRRFGDEYTFQEVASTNISLFNEFKFGAMISHCPHCLHTIGKEYSKFPAGEYKVIPHAEILNDLNKRGLFKDDAPMLQNGERGLEQEKERVTFHDPCYLGRHHGDFDSVRSLINQTKTESVEMTNNKESSRCCGMGGGNMWYELPEGEHLAHNRLKDIAETKPNTLVTSCPFCFINFESNKGHHDQTSSLPVKDIAVFLLEKSF